jgi:hypothetical protein
MTYGEKAIQYPFDESAILRLLDHSPEPSIDRTTNYWRRSSIPTP